METARLSDQGQDVIFLTVGDQDLAAREPGIDAPDRGAFRGARLKVRRRTRHGADPVAVDAGGCPASGVILTDDTQIRHTGEGGCQEIDRGGERRAAARLCVLRDAPVGRSSEFVNVFEFSNLLTV